MNRRQWIFTGLLLAAILMALAAPVTSGNALAQDAMSRVRFLHAVPGAPNVDVYLDGAPVASNVAYSDVTPHIQVPAGDHQIALRLAGSSPDAAALVEVPAVPLVANFAFLVVFQGSPDALEAVRYEDFLDEIIPGMARIAAINAISDAPPLDLLTSAGSPLLPGVSYGSQFSTININTGLQDLVFVPAGGALESAVAEVGVVPLHSGVLYTFVAIGTLEGDTPAETLVIPSPVNGTADSVRVRVAHGSPDVAAVDVYANDTLLVPSLAFGEFTAHMPIPAGTYTLNVRPAGAAPTDDPAISAEVTLDAAIPAVTVAAVGELGDGTLALQTFADNVEGIVPDMARLSVINAVPGATATASATDPSGTVLASDLAANAQSEVIDIAPGNYMLTVSVAGVDNPVDVIVPAESYTGGMYYNVLVFGGGAQQQPYNVAVAGTEIVVEPGSLPGASGEVMVVTTPMEEAPATEVVEAPPAEVTEEAPPAEVVTDEAPPAEVVTDEAPPAEVVTEEPSTEVVEAPPAQEETEVVETPPTEAPAAPAALVTPQPRPSAFIDLNPGANLHCRELPASDARSLGLIPSGTQVTVLGRTGTPLVPETGGATPEPTPEVNAVEELWLSILWEPESGGFLRCWVSAQFLRVEFRGRLLDELEELWELPEVPFNEPGEAVDTDVAPPTPIFDAVLATVELEPGVSLQLRRFPQTDAEALARVPAQAQLEVLGYAEVPSEGLVGQPTNPNWLRVRYRQETGGSIIGWVSAEYVSLSQLGRPVEIETLLVVDPEEGGFFEAAGELPQIPIEQQAVIGQVNLNPGANLNLRDQPTADARVIVGIPSGATMEINGRNADGTWVQVTYETADGQLLDGWVATQYLIVSRGGQPFDILTLPNLWDQG